MFMTLLLAEEKNIVHLIWTVFFNLLIQIIDLTKMDTYNISYLYAVFVRGLLPVPLDLFGPDIVPTKNGLHGTLVLNYAFGPFPSI